MKEKYIRKSIYIYVDIETDEIITQNQINNGYRLINKSKNNTYEYGYDKYRNRYTIITTEYVCQCRKESKQGQLFD